MPISTQRARLCDSWSLTHIADALTFRGRSLVLRKEQRILAFLVLKITCSPTAKPLNPLIHCEHCERIYAPEHEVLGNPQRCRCLARVSVRMLPYH